MVHRLPDTSWQIEHDDDLWQVFRAMGNGFKALLMHASDGKHIELVGKDENGNAEFYVKLEIMEELQSCGFVKVMRDNLPNGTDESYELSDEGMRIYETLKRMSPEESKGEFLSQFRKYRRESNTKTQ
ncbi:MAG: hypothetical protein ACR2G4_03715 [Pyrinomonadaceae bacterium]